MTETPEIPPEKAPAPRLAHDGGQRPNKDHPNSNSDLYTSTGGCDSTSGLDDAAEDYLRESIEEVRADIAKRKRTGTSGARRSDAALIKFIVSYVAAHSDPQSFLRNLQTAISSPGSSPRKLEPTDA